MHHWTVTGGWLQLILVAVLMFLFNPLHYLATGLIIWDLVRNIRSERIWFGVRVTRIVKPMVIRYLKACVVGLLASIALVLAGAAVSWQTVLFVALLSIALGLLRTRFAASPFAIAVALTLSAISRLIVVSGQSAWADTVTFLQGFEMTSWFLIGVVACLCELFVQWWNARDAVLPALVTSKRGRRIGALKVQLGFVVPLVLWMTPLQGISLSFHAAVRPWLIAADKPLAICVIPLVFGVHALFTALRPERVLIQWRWLNLIQAAILAGGFVIHYWLHSEYAYILPPVFIVVTEVMRILWRRVDASTDPLCAPSSQGVMVLYTIHQSLSDKLGILPGEIVTHVNQQPVHTEYDLHFAFEQNPAYAKFQVVDTRGEVRLVGNPVYEGERHQLGLIVVVPDDQPALKLARPFGFLETLYLRRHRQRSRPT